MSNCGCSPSPCIPCAPLNFCQPPDFGLAFPSLVGPQGPPGGPGTFLPNYAATRAINATIFETGYIAYVMGYSTPGDGGEGYFQYIADSTADDNDGTVLEPSNGVGRWLRIFSGAFNVRWFGTPIGESGNAAPGINRAIQAALATNPGAPEVYIPNGRYLVSAPGIIAHDGLGNGVMITGGGKESTRLNCQVGTSTDSIVWVNATLYGRGGGIRNISVWSPSDVATRNHIVFEQWNNFSISDVNVTRASVNNINIRACTHVSIENAVLAGAVVTGLAYDSFVGQICTTASNRNVYITGSGQPGADVTGININFIDCVFESNGFGTGSEGCRQRDGSSTFVGCYFEDNEGDDLCVGYDAPAGWSNGSYVAIVNPFTQGLSHKAAGRGGFRAIRGQMDFFGPGMWFNPTKTILVEPANGALVRLYGLPPTLSPAPEMVGGGVLPVGAYGNAWPKMLVGDGTILGNADISMTGDTGLFITANGGSPYSAAVNLTPTAGGRGQIAVVGNNNLQFLRNAIVRAEVKAAVWNFSSVPNYADNAAAILAGLVSGDMYRITGADTLAIVH